jgi:lysophospholipase L1-like esterase
MPPGDICPINVQENDIVLFCYGWNDVQKNIHTYSNGDYKSMIDGLVYQYIEIIRCYSDGTLFKIRPIVNCVYPLPLSINNTITGTDQDRILYTRYMNERLQAVCLENKIPFFDIYDLISVDDKLDMQYVDKDMTHLNRKLPELREIIELKLLKICEDICK